MTPPPPLDNTVHLGDCVAFMKTLPDKCVDFVCTEPPYGIDFGYDQHDDNFEGWKRLMGACIPEWLRICRGPIVFPSCSNDALVWLFANYPPKWMMAWYNGSPGHRSAIGFNDWEPLFVLGEKIHRNTHDHFYAKPTDAHIDWHPCPKSMEYAKTLITKFSDEGDLVFDPFGGSGTTFLAAAQGNRRYLGCELSPAYHAKILQRLELETAQGKMF